jgi:hypothetical protein
MVGFSISRLYNEIVTTGVFIFFGDSVLFAGRVHKLFVLLLLSQHRLLLRKYWQK